MYFGVAANLPTYFSNELRLDCPRYVNPADFTLDALVDYDASTSNLVDAKLKNEGPASNTALVASAFPEVFQKSTTARELNANIEKLDMNESNSSERNGQEEEKSAVRIHLNNSADREHATNGFLFES